MPATLEQDIAVNSLAQYVALFVPGGALAPKRRWYRGDGRLRAENALLPSIARPPTGLGREWEVYQRFRQNAAAFLPYATMSNWDWTLYMRHFEAPTPLLHWTERPL